MNNNKVRTSVSVPNELYRDLKRIIPETNLSQSDFICKAIEREIYLQNYNRPSFVYGGGYQAPIHAADAKALNFLMPKKKRARKADEQYLKLLAYHVVKDGKQQEVRSNLLNGLEDMTWSKIEREDMEKLLHYIDLKCNIAETLPSH